MAKVSMHEEVMSDAGLLNQQIDEDIAELEKHSSSIKPESYNRLYIRLIGTSIDAQISFLKSLLRRKDFIFSNMPTSPQDFSIRNLKKKLHERTLVRKEKRFKDDLVKTINDFLVLRESRLFVNIESQLLSDISDLIDIRNKITHPYLTSDLEISREEYEKCRKTYYSIMIVFAVILGTGQVVDGCEGFFEQESRI